MPARASGRSASRRAEPYAAYATFYDATQRASHAAHYRYLLGRHHREALTVLELACGTGANLAVLAEHYSVEGLDLSRAMLKHARRKLPNVTFHRQDMSDFNLPRRFDAVICPYDSINHLVRFSDWVRTFKAVKRHLNPGGVFIFDANTEYRLRELAAAPPSVRRFGDHYLIMSVSLSKRGVSDWSVNVFERTAGQRYRLHHDEIQERAFDNARVMAALESQFRSVRAYDALGWSRPKATSRRLFYVCR